MTCPWCGCRDALSGVDACGKCIAPVRDVTEPMTYEMRLFRYIQRNPGATFDDVCVALDIGDYDRGALHAALYRMTKRGALRSWKAKTITRQYQAGLEMSYEAVRWVDGGKKEAA